jgi:hypothetical protein
MTRLDAIVARLEAATPGPWKCGYTTDDSRMVAECLDGEGMHVEGVFSADEPVLNGLCDDSFSNSLLIAHAPADLADLLAVAQVAARVTAGVTDNPDVFTVDGHDLLALREAVDALEGQR